MGVESYTYTSFGLSVIEGIDLLPIISEDEIADVVRKVRYGGGEIVGLLKTGSTRFAPALSVVKMVEAILSDS